MLDRFTKLMKRMIANDAFYQQLIGTLRKEEKNNTIKALFNISIRPLPKKYNLTNDKKQT